MKKIISYTIAALTLASCANDELVTGSTNDEITYDVVSNSLSRASTYHPDATGLSTFSVYAAPSGDYSKGFYIQNQTITKGSDGKWTASKQHYWPKSDALDFYAIVDAQDWDEVENKDKNDVKGELRYETNSNGTSNWMYFEGINLPISAANQKDLLFATAASQTKPTNNNAVSLTFNHALAGLRIKINPGERMNIYVNEVEVVNVYNTGNLILYSNSDVPDWTFLGSDGNLYTTNSSKLTIDEAYAPHFQKTMVDGILTDGTGLVKPTNSTDDKDAILYLIPQTTSMCYVNNTLDTDVQYLRISCRIFNIADAEGYVSNIVSTTENPVTDGLLYGNTTEYDKTTGLGGYRDILIPVKFSERESSNSVEAQEDYQIVAGKLYTYTLNFNNLTSEANNENNQGYNPDDPSKPAMEYNPITYTVSISGFGDGSSEDKIVNTTK